MTTKNKLKILNKIKIMCWSALILAFLLKILGVYYIDKGLNVDWLINLNEFVCKYPFLKVGLSVLSDTFITFMMVLIVNRKAKLNTKDTIVVLIVSLSCYAFKYNFRSIGLISDVITTFILPVIICKDKRKVAIIRTIIMFVMMNAFQIISMITRIGELKILESNIIVNQVMLLDYYIMFILYYLHSIKK